MGKPAKVFLIIAIVIAAQMILASFILTVMGAIDRSSVLFSIPFGLVGSTWLGIVVVFAITRAAFNEQQARLEKLELQLRELTTPQTTLVD
jgi:membrane protein implicated in regulation of membrane protease activity